MPTIVALVCREPNEPLVRYLEDAGFEVRAARTPLGAPREGVLVWLTDQAGDQRRDDRTDDRTIVAAIRAWLGTKADLRVILVTGRPVPLGAAAADARGRIVLLPAPVFGWQLVDALRDAGSRSP